MAERLQRQSEDGMQQMHRRLKAQEQKKELKWRRAHLAFLDAVDEKRQKVPPPSPPPALQ